MPSNELTTWVFNYAFETLKQCKNYAISIPGNKHAAALRGIVATASAVGARCCRSVDKYSPSIQLWK
jgi:hypothetical protein